VRAATKEYDGPAIRGDTLPDASRQAEDDHPGRTDLNTENERNRSTLLESVATGSPETAEAWDKI
jgi:hypothetical protein